MADSNKTNTTATHVDPVCGMQVQEDESAGTSNYDGETYYFCSAECKREFDEDPEDYV